MLVLVPTPISDDADISLDLSTTQRLLKACSDEKSLFLVEDLKPGRARWIKLGLPREHINDLIAYNEHSALELNAFLVSEMKQGKVVYLMSDSGLPCFCDPGKELVFLCHKNKIQVTAMSFSNSTLLALVFSGFDNEKFLFEGFLPLDNKRQERLKSLSTYPETIILMDTPYRLKRLLEEINSFMPERLLFIGMDLNSTLEEYHIGFASELLKDISEFKREFVLILNSLKK